MPEHPAHEEPVIEGSAQVALKVLQPDFYGLVAGSTRGLPTNVLGALSADLRPLTCNADIEKLGPLQSGLGEPIGGPIDGPVIVAVGYPDAHLDLGHNGAIGAILPEMRAEISL